MGAFFDLPASQYSQSGPKIYIFLIFLELGDLLEVKKGKTHVPTFSHLFSEL